MFWIALLVLAVLGFGKPRIWLTTQLRETKEDLLKVFVGIGIFLFLVFGLLSVGRGMTFFAVLLPAFGVWLGVIAGFELGRRQQKYGDLEEYERPTPIVEQRSRSSSRTSESLFYKDPWGALAAKNKQSSVSANTDRDLFPTPASAQPVNPELVEEAVEAATELPPVPEPPVPVPEPPAPPPVPSLIPAAAAADSAQNTSAAEARADVVDVIRELAERRTAEEPADAGESAEPVPVAAHDSGTESQDQARDEAAPEPATEQEARPLSQTAGKYSYQPKLVKSRFGDK